MDKNEKAAVTVRIYDSTSQLINKWKGNAPIGLFIDNAVEHYVKYLAKNDDIAKQISQSINEIQNSQKVTLGLLCEVLKQNGVLDAGGDIIIPKI
ncbi:MAG: hypothetical protein J6S85_19830 [Methanobrevibacter sp.]|nr:hypothetical protein [Methanobrevibacter sp.]